LHHVQYRFECQLAQYWRRDPDWHDSFR
jgi:hypothetical protein